MGLLALIDIDYKGLSNIGSWFLGKLQTKQDKDRVMDGLIKDSADYLSKNEIALLLSNMEKRTFLLKSVHLDHLSLFQTRWVLSYLRGPLSKPEIKKLMAEKNRLLNEGEAEEGKSSVKEDSTISKKTASLPLISDKIPQYFLNNSPYNEEIIFEPKILLKGKIRFYSESKGIDEKEEVFLKLQKKYNRLLEKLGKEETDTKTVTTESVLSLGATLLGAFLGRTKVGNLSSGMTGLRRANRIFKEKKDVNLVKNQIEELTKEIEKLEGELNEKIVEISEKFDIDNYEIETFSLQPRKSDISNLSVSLLWESR